MVYIGYEYMAKEDESAVERASAVPPERRRPATACR